jgi:hypothetical protein
MMSAVPKAQLDFTAIDWISLDELTSPTVRLGVEHWHKLCGDRSFPAREQVKPRDIVSVLSAMSLLKVLEGGDFQYRIAGDAVVRAYDLRLQNRRLSEIEEESASFHLFVRPVLSHVVSRRSPLALRGKIGHDARRTHFTHHENALLPLGPSDDKVDHVLVFSNYERRAV